MGETGGKAAAKKVRNEASVRKCIRGRSRVASDKVKVDLAPSPLAISPSAPFAIGSGSLDGPTGDRGFDSSWSGLALLMSRRILHSRYCSSRDYQVVPGSSIPVRSNASYIPIRKILDGILAATRELYRSLLGFKIKIKEKIRTSSPSRPEPPVDPNEIIGGSLRF